MVLYEGTGQASKCMQFYTRPHGGADLLLGLPSRLQQVSGFFHMFMDFKVSVQLRNMDLDQTNPCTRKLGQICSETRHFKNSTGLQGRTKISNSVEFFTVQQTCLYAL